MKMINWKNRIKIKFEILKYENDLPSRLERTENDCYLFF